VSLGSRISPKHSNWSISVIRYEQGDEVGKGTWMLKGGRVGLGRVGLGAGHHGLSGGRGSRRKP